MLFILHSDSTIEGRSLLERGTPPPTSPVLPPWAMMSTDSELQNLTTSATSLVDDVLTTAVQVPENRPVQSVS